MLLCVFTQPFERIHWGCRLHWSCRSPERVQGSSSIRVSFEVFSSDLELFTSGTSCHLRMYHKVDLYI